MAFVAQSYMLRDLVGPPSSGPTRPARWRRPTGSTACGWRPWSRRAQPSSSTAARSPRGQRPALRGGRPGGGGWATTCWPPGAASTSSGRPANRAGSPRPREPGRPDAGACGGGRLRRAGQPHPRGGAGGARRGRRRPRHGASRVLDEGDRDDPGHGAAAQPAVARGAAGRARARGRRPGELAAHYTEEAKPTTARSRGRRARARRPPGGSPAATWRRPEPMLAELRRRHRRRRLRRPPRRCTTSSRRRCRPGSPSTSCAAGGRSRRVPRPPIPGGSPLAPAARCPAGRGGG